MRGRWDLLVCERTWLVTLQHADTGPGASLAQPPQPPAEDDGATPSKPARRRTTRRARWLLIGLLVLLLAVAAVAAWAVFFRGSSTATTTLRTETISAGTLKQTVSASGTLDPATESDLSFSSSGTVTSVSVSAGDVVKKGQELAKIDDSELEIAYDSAKASLTEAKESLSDLEDDDSSTATAISAAKAGIKVKKNAVTQAKAALEDATMVSPIAGKVADVSIAKGDTVSGASSTTSSGTSSSSGTSGSTSTNTASSSSTAAVTVISDGTFSVTTSVSNSDVTSIKKGLQATITATGSTDAVYGTVTSVGVVASSTSSSTSSSSSSGSATFPVTIGVTGTHKTLLPGSSATVAITVKQLTNVISVPTQAVTSTNGTTVVQKLVAGKQVATPVTLGASVGTSTVVTKGLAAGDQIVLASFRAQGSTGSGTRQGGTGEGGFGGTGGFNGGTGGTGGFGAPGQNTGGTNR